MEICRMLSASKYSYHSLKMPSIYVFGDLCFKSASFLSRRGVRPSVARVTWMLLMREIERRRSRDGRSFNRYVKSTPLAQLWALLTSPLSSEAYSSIPRSKLYQVLLSVLYPFLPLPLNLTCIKLSVCSHFNSLIHPLISKPKKPP
jgi:hypothetical protein